MKTYILDSVEIKKCECGCYPKFIIPNDGYTDCWLECPKCGRRTENTGGFYYAMEIPIDRAQIEAAILWNSGDTYKEVCDEI